MPKWKIAVLLALWSSCLAAGLGAMFEYELTPADTAQAKATWPEGSKLARDAKLPTLVMFFHPQCPCSRASLRELQTLASDARGRFALRIVFVRPVGFADGWERTSLYTTAGQIPGAVLSCDPGGVEAARFGATTSGEAMLYSADGPLEFQGGITPSRGHEGESAGRTAIGMLIGGHQPLLSKSPVYGCRLGNQCIAEKERSR